MWPNLSTTSSRENLHEEVDFGLLPEKRHGDGSFLRA